MPWNGYRDSQSDVGDGWEAMENVSFYVKGQCRRRLGFGGRVNLSGAVVRSAAEQGSYVLLATAAGAILSVTQSSGSVASLATGLSTTNWPSWAALNGRLYYTNGVDAVRVSDAGASIRTAGITAPASAATASNTSSGGVVSSGVHLIRYRYYDSSRTRYSDPSTAVTLTVTAGSKILVGYTASGDATVDKVIIEMTPVDAETYYQAATITNSGSSYTLDISDSNLIIQTTAAKNGEFHHLPPPTMDMLAEHRQRVWGIAISSSLLYWSRATFPESWDSVNYARRITLESGDAPSALMSFYSDLYVFGQRSIRRVVYTGDPSAGMVVDVPGNFGCFNARCVIKIDGGMMIGWGRNGAWMIDAMQPKKISSDIDDTFASLSDASALTQRFICYEPTRREVAFVFPLSGATTCKAAFVYALDSGEWTLWKWRQGMTAGVSNTQYTDRQRLMLCDENGYAWRVGVSANDGGGNGVVTATSGSTTTVINATNTATVGQVITRVSTGEERVITAASGAQITVAALASAPTAGEILRVGSIRVRMLTEWWPGSSLADKKRPTKFLLAIRPDGDMGEGSVAYYQDYGSTAITVTAGSSDDWPQGIDIVDDSTAVTVDFDDAEAGYIPAPMPGDWKRTLRAEIIHDDPRDGVVFLDASFRNDSTIPVGDE